MDICEINARIQFYPGKAIRLHQNQQPPNFNIIIHNMHKINPFGLPCYIEVNFWTVFDRNFFYQFASKGFNLDGL